MPASNPPPLSPSPPILIVRTGAGSPDFQELRFTSSFRIGRGEQCEFRIQNEYVSRQQAEVVFENGQWYVRDLRSSNGIYVGERRVDEVSVTDSLTIRLGIKGPTIAFEVQQPPTAATPGESTAVYVDRYFSEAPANENAGEHTIMVRRAFQRVQTRQKRKYRGMVLVLVLTVAGVGTYAWYQHRQASQQTAVARELFYAMKSLDVDIAGVEKLVLETQNPRGLEQVNKYQNRRKELERSYNRFLTALRVYDPKMTAQQRIILRMARVFGECELAMPPGFTTEVENYIRKWQSSPRLVKAVQTARQNGYVNRITNELLANHLAPQFFYLALQESDFNPYASGPPTKKGFAKGMWQFIPETAAKYGLRVGPLADFQRPDPADDRHNWEKATSAAARYLKDIYSTDAQASGLLVVASYNWGEDRVIRLIQSMPANPQQRNFWRLLTDYRDKLPPETYNYVFYIFSAAVIGENPRLFGFHFDNPLADAENQVLVRE